MALRNFCHTDHNFMHTIFHYMGGFLIILIICIRSQLTRSRLALVILILVARLLSHTLYIKPEPCYDA